MVSGLTGPHALADADAAVLTLAQAGASPRLGRLMDRRGQGACQAIEDAVALARALGPGDGVEAADVLELDSVEAIKQCVAAGMGVAVLPAVTVAAELERGEISALAWEGPELGGLTQVAWRKDKWLSPALEAFLSMSRDVLGAGDLEGAGRLGR